MATQKRFLAKNGLDNNSQTIQNVATPVNTTDATTKAYVDLKPDLSSTTPAALGTATVGVGTTAARSDHVHLAQTTITGNAGTATSIAGGVANNVPYQTAAGTTAFVPVSTVAGQVLTTAAAGGAPTWVTPTAIRLSSAITGYAVGTNTALAATDTILAAFGKLQGQVTATPGTVTGVTGTAPVASSGGTAPVISMAAATTSVPGYLTAADWTTFNGKQPAGSYLTAVSAANIATAIAPSTSGNVLTSNGSAWTSAAPASGGFTNMVVYTTTTTWTIPAGITKCKVTVVGGGGGGSCTGYNPCNPTPVGGGGGGSGGAAYKYLTGLTPLSTLTATIGAGGTAGYTAWNTSAGGGSGGTSSLSSGTQTIATITATGGAGGVSSSNVSGVGGSASGGTLNMEGTKGGVYFGAPSILGGGGGSAGGAGAKGGGGGGNDGSSGGTAGLGGAGVIIIEY
ncbi:hypothetical protein UFOVP1516_70 [uncultured Caudovirales phage]|uniref:Glycine-rich domain-containing protein n=1 Tax=uncultured Caudovirales phage TaxID=2100421 RepID=A0A6J7XAY5_9CAUD|nr:hypothetical protein UFOVP887_65 [uncultured Caudovirales phage]CAB5226947.1 hypothetical protein UFOVP1516_70 [uncultured Caudovirales phage]